MEEASYLTQLVCEKRDESYRNLTSDWAGTVICGGRLISGTLQSVVKVTGTDSGFSTVRVAAVLWRTGVTNSMVLMTPGGVDLKVTL